MGNETGRKKTAWLALACVLLAGCAAGQGSACRGAAEQVSSSASLPPADNRESGSFAGVDWTGLSSSVLVHSWRAFSVERDADLGEFFRSCGFDAAEPFYTYRDPAGETQLALYYDRETERGAGVRYEYGDAGAVLYGFEFEELGLTEEAEGDRWSRWETDYAALPELDHQSEVRDYRTEVVRDEQGRVVAFRSYGVLGDWTGSGEREPEWIFSAGYEYDAAGVLRYRQFAQTQKLFSSSDSFWESYFDERGRVCYERGYLTHGSQEYYYLYEGEEAAPAYCLYLDNDCGCWTAEFVQLLRIEN